MTERSGKVSMAGNVAEGSGKVSGTGKITEGFGKVFRWLMADDAPDDGLTPEEREETARANRCGFRVLFRKELADHLSGKRFRVLYILLLPFPEALHYGRKRDLQLFHLPELSGPGVRDHARFRRGE